MLNPFKKNKPQANGIPTADEKPRMVKTQPLVEEPQPTPEPEPPGPDALPPEVDEVAAKFAGQSAEELCGVDASMPEEEIRRRLAKLFTRHNRAASSFDLELRAEAEIMLQSIVSVREKYIEKL